MDYSLPDEEPAPPIVHQPRPTHPLPSELPQDVAEDDIPVQKTQYVLSGQPTGWSAMDTKVRDFDEEKARDVYDDIDSLLVFVRH